MGGFMNPVQGDRFICPFSVETFLNQREAATGSESSSAKHQDGYCEALKQAEKEEILKELPRCVKGEKKKIYEIPNSAIVFGNIAKNYNLETSPLKIIEAPDYSGRDLHHTIDCVRSRVLVSLMNVVYIKGELENSEPITSYSFDDLKVISSVRWKSDRSFILGGLDTSNHSIIKYFSREINRAKREFDLGEQGCVTRTVVKTGVTFFAATEKSSLFLIDAQKKSCAAEYKNLHGKTPIYNIALSPFEHELSECGLIATGGGDGNCHIWDVRKIATGFPLQTIAHKVHEAGSIVRAIAWHPKKEGVIATGGGCFDQKVKLSMVGSGELCTAQSASSEVMNVVWSPDGSFFLSTGGSSLNDIKFWESNIQKNALAIKLIHTIPYAHEDKVFEAVRDEAYLATASSDETIKFWKFFDVKLKRKHRRSLSALR